MVYLDLLMHLKELDSETGQWIPDAARDWGFFEQVSFFIANS